MTFHSKDWISLFSKVGAVAAGISLAIGGNIVEGVGIVLAAFTGQITNK